MIIELRRYPCMPGLRDEWITLFQEVVLPFMASKGMIVVGSFVDEADPDTHVWMRRFDDEAHREQLYAAVYQSAEWKDEIMPRIKGLLIADKIIVTRLQPTSASPVR